MMYGVLQPLGPYRTWISLPASSRYEYGAVLVSKARSQGLLPVFVHQMHRMLLAQLVQGMVSIAMGRAFFARLKALVQMRLLAPVGSDKHTASGVSPVQLL